jgi:hypothetical protein
VREPFSDIAAAMPHDDASGPLALAIGASRGIELNVVADDTYVWPDVSVEDKNEASPIVLMMAPGAMGKSTAARAVASQLGMPYVNLAEMHVGTGSLTGELLKSFGAEDAAAFMTALKEGRASLILDSTDEAQLAAGPENYKAFLADIAWLLVDAVAARQVLMLGRRDATETTYLQLSDLGFDAPRYEILPLSHDQASRMIDLALDARSSSGSAFDIHRTHYAPFGALRDALMADIASALEPTAIGADYWPQVDAFLGYPPVLLALAERLAVDNPAAELAEFNASAKRTQRALRGELLREVVERILDRESLKVRKKLGEALAIRPDDAQREVLYSRDEQAARLLNFTGTAGITLSVPASLSDSERAKYEEHIENFLLDHPFLHGSAFANPVFSDYIRAWAVSSTISGLYTSSRRDFLGTLPKPGPFFAHFLHALTLNKSVGLVPEDLISDTIHSYALGSENDRSVIAGRTGAVKLILLDDGRLSDPDSPLLFDVTELSGVIELKSPIARLTCVTEDGVILSGTGGRFDLGPEAVIVAGQLEIDAKVLTIFGGNQGEHNYWCLLSAAEVAHAQDLKLVAYPSDSALEVFWPDAWHQWKPFLLEKLPVGTQVSPIISAQIFVAVRRLLTSFKSSVTDDPSVSADKVDRILVGSNPVFKAVLDALIEFGVVERQAALYRLDLDRLGTFGISYSTLRGDNPAASLSEISETIMKSASFETFLKAQD